MSYSYILSLAIEKVKAELKASYKFIKHDGLILETFATNLLKLNSGDVPKTIEYLETLSKKDILDKLQVIIKELETTKEIVEIIKTSIQVETGKLKDKQAKVDALDKETDFIKSKRDALKSDLIKVKTEQDTTKTEFQKLQESREAISKEKIIQLEHTKTLLQDTIDGVFRNEVYEDEFNIPESKYILKEPSIHLNVDKIIDDLGLPELFEFTKDEFILESQYNIDNLPKDHMQQQWALKSPHGKKTVKLNFPINMIFDENEYIIKIFVNNNRIKQRLAQYGVLNCEYNTYIIYITNYGRIIRSDYIVYDVKKVLDMGISREYKFIANKINIIESKTLYHLRYTFNNICGYNPQTVLPILIREIPETILLDEARLPLLTYKMPKLFLDVINAFNKASTDEMQTCCKRYLDITRESKRKHDVLTSLEFNKQLKEKDEALKEKNTIIEEKDLIISQQTAEIARLKGEIAKIKSMVLNIF
jgi:hypothetical protein